MPQLDLSKDEVAMLRETLESTLSDLRYEINNTDSHDFKQTLRAKQAVLEKSIAQLG